MGNCIEQTKKKSMDESLESMTLAVCISIPTSVT